MSEEQPKIHPTSTKAYGEGNSQLYNRARPSYHPTVVAFMRETIKKPGPLNIVEIGSGSGILTRNVLDHPLWNTDTAAIQAIEPNEGLRQICGDVVKDPRVTVRDGTFENTGVENGWADAILMASAFHWCLNYKDAMTEFARILKPDGVVVCVWYEGDREVSPFVTKLWSLEEYMGDFSQHQYSRNSYYQQLWRSAFIEPNFLSHFTAPEEDIIKYVDSYTVESWSDFVMTWSWVAVLSEEQKNAARKRVKEVIEGGEEVGMKWVDKEHGIWEHPWKSRVVVFRKKVNTNVSASTTIMFVRMYCRTPVRVHFHHTYSTYSTPTPTQLSALRTWSNNITSIHRHTHDHISPSKVLDLLCTLPTRSPLIAPAYGAYQLGTHSSPFTSAYETHDALSKLFRKGAPLLPTHSLAFFHAHAPEEMLGVDRTEMDFNPSEESGFVRRMWAGGRFTWGKERDALLVGRDACASARVAKVEMKGFEMSSTATTTTAPPMVFVHQDIEYRHSDDPKVLFTEERVHVYLPVSEGKPRQTARTVSGIPAISDFTFTWTPSQTALFRFSALMFNAHLIHLDRGHTRSEEGLPDLLVHGPLTAIMLVENYLVSGKESKLPISFEYRARNPVLVDKRQHLKGKFDNTGKKAFVWAEDDDGIVGMTGTLEF